MSENKEEWHEVTWFCSNCGTKVTAVQNSEGLSKAECQRCHSVTVRRKMGRRHSRIEMYAAKISQAAI